MKKRMLIFRPEHNAHGKKDVTYAFKPEAEKFQAAVCTKDSKIVVIDNKRPNAERQFDVLFALQDAELSKKTYHGIAFFCHGWKTGIQLGFRNKDVETLADRIQRICNHDMTNVPLYCCSTAASPKQISYARRRGTSRGLPHDAFSSPGEGDNSFADLLRDALCAQGAKYSRVMGHTTVAHTTKNPHVVFFDGMGTKDGGVGGYRPVGPRSSNWKAWRKALRETDLRFRFPFMTVEEIHAELDGD